MFAGLEFNRCKGYMCVATSSGMWKSLSLRTELPFGAVRLTRDPLRSYFRCIRALLQSVRGTKRIEGKDEEDKRREKSDEQRLEPRIRNIGAIWQDWIPVGRQEDVVHHAEISEQESVLVFFQGNFFLLGVVKEVHRIYAQKFANQGRPMWILKSNKNDMFASVCLSISHIPYACSNQAGLIPWPRRKGLVRLRSSDLVRGECWTMGTFFSVCDIVFTRNRLSAEKKKKLPEAPSEKFVTIFSNPAFRSWWKRIVAGAVNLSQNEHLPLSDSIRSFSSTLHRFLRYANRSHSYARKIIFSSLSWLWKKLPI